MTTRPPMELRRQVVERADNGCEYCLIHQDLVASTHQVDHVIAEKHGGSTSLDNLALSCTTCNRRKASDIASFDPTSGELTTLFNPRTQTWQEHFQLRGPRIEGLSPEGRTTVDFLQLNSHDRTIERRAFIKAGCYPSSKTIRKPR